MQVSEIKCIFVEKNSILMIKRKKIRLDELLVLRGLAQDTDLARRLIMAAKVKVNGQKIDKSATLIEETAIVAIQEKAYVSRGGVKLAGFLNSTGLNHRFQGASVLDVGASTGGFSDCSLRNGAQSVACLDVGKGLLDWNLRQDPRVKVFEETHLRDFAATNSMVFDIVLADVSFNSIARLFQYIHQINRCGDALIILLVKPQFELARERVPSGGVITDETDRLQVLAEVEKLLVSHGYEVIASEPSVLKGNKGNQEYFIAVTRQGKARN